MISLKKTYAEQLLQLALALSLLRADPDSFLGWNWESSRLALQNGGDGNDGWQLEMRTTPMSDYPYANRKHVMPRLIEDLIRFDPANSHDVTAYLLNVQRTDEGGAATSVEEAPVVNTTETDINLSSIINGGAPDEMDFFINSDQFLYSESILEQNIADLGDYARELNDLNFNAPYFALPMKDEPLDIDIPLYKVKEDPEEDQATASEVPWSSDHMRFNPPEIVIKREIKEEPDDERNSTSGVSSGSSSRSGNPGSRSTSECSTSSAMPIAGCSVKEDDFSEEESEIVEVLWKQDVDLGFTLTPSKEPQVKEQPANSSDDIEKIKALQDLENEKSNETLAKNVLDESDAWNGIQFTIDNETGEYIQLPLQLDELLQDVLQLGVLDAADDSEVKDISEDSLAETQDLVSFAESLEGDDLDILGENVELKTNDNTEQASATTTSIDQAAAETDTQLDKSGLDTPSFSDLENAANDLDELDMMIQSSGPFHHHHHPHSHLNHHHLNPLGNPHHPLSHLNHPHHVQAQHIAATSSAVPVNRMPNGQGYINSNAVISSNGPPNGGASGFRQTATSTYPHHPQSRVPPLSRGVSMEQRLQDIANLFNPLPGMGVGMGVGEMSSPYSHYPSHYPYQGAGPIPPPPTAGAGSQHTQFAPHVLHDINVTGGAGGQPHYGPNLGTAVSSSMHLTNSSHEAEGGATGYKMDHDLMYYSNTSSELNHTTDGFINSILNDEDLQLMDMGVNESFYTMRMLDNNATSNNSSVLSGGASSNGLLSSAMSLSTNGNQTNTANGATGTTNTANGDRLDASSDSAVSSMGSERVPSLSDSEWGDAGSDSAQDYHHHGGGGKYGGASGGPYDYSRHQPPVAQKKHQMFGKRFLNHQDVQGGGAIGGPLPNIEQNPVKYEYEPYGTLPMEGAVGLNGKSSAISTIPNPSVPLTPAEMKYSCSLDFARTSMVHHNHTYTLSPESNGATPRPQTRDKKLKKMSSGGNNSSSLSVQEDEHLTRDEKRARALNIPMPVHEIINLPMDEFNERLSKYDLSESQLSLIRDIRRRGKNKVAAQNCRKRKLDQILSLADEVKEMRRQKDRLLRDRELALSDRSRIRKKFAALHQHIFQHLRDPDGNLYSSSQYSLQQSADGTVFLLPREKPDGSSNGNSSSSGNNSSSSSMNGTHQHHQHHHQHPHHPKE